MAIIKRYAAIVTDIKQHVDGVYTLEIGSIEKPFKYEPGQFLHLTIDDYDPSGQWPESRCFSIQSNQSEKNLRITYSVKGKYTQKMQKLLTIGSGVWVKMPYGDLFTREHNKENTVFVAGGTGLTPFLSLFNDSSFSNYKNPVLFAGFKDRTMNFYHQEIGRAKEINHSFITKFVYEVENGLINLSDVLNIADPESTYFISGPPPMIKSFKESLKNSGIPLLQIQTDDWS